MKSFAVLALAALAMAQSSPPAGCQASTSGSFQISTVNVTSPRKRDLESRQVSGVLTLSLNNGNLKDQAGRQGYIASNFQFQFDAPIQAGARETTGFSLCGNNSLALGSSAIWYQCFSGNLYNLYSQSLGRQCFPIYIVAVKQGGASQISDGQPQATRPAPAVSQISDGQPQASRPVVSQISDGQPQASRPAAVSTPRPVVTQISDGQPQAPTPRASLPVVSQISDGQPQAPTPRASLPVVSQISDGQPQASRPVAVSTPRPVVTQISDGQPQAPIPTSIRSNITANATLPAAPSQFTGAAATGKAAVGALAAGLLGLFAML